MVDADLTDTLHPTLPGDHFSSDIAVIELRLGDLPADAAVARACYDEFTSSIEIRGYALQANLMDGHPITGRKQDSLSDHRIAFVANVQDLVTRPGASGTPLFLESRGMVGIVVAAQAYATGFYIPVEVIGRYVPELTKPVGPAGRQHTDEAAQMLRLRLNNHLSRLDRVPQCKAFRNRFAPVPLQTGNSFVCLIAGTADDMPDECLNRMASETCQLIDGRLVAGIRSSALDDPQSEEGPVPLNWPTQRRFDPARALQALVRDLHARLSAQRPPFADAIRTVMNGEMKPLLYASDIKASAFSRDHRILLGLWLDLLDQLNQRPLAQPMVHFLTFQFDEGARPVDPEEDSGVEAQLDRLLAEGAKRSIFSILLGRSRPEPPLFNDRISLTRLPALGLVDRWETKAWIAKVAAGMRKPPDERSLGVVCNDYMEIFAGKFGVRLMQIERRSRLGDGERDRS